MALLDKLIYHGVCMIYVCHNIHLFFEQMLVSSKSSLILKSCFFHPHRQLLFRTIVDDSIVQHSDSFLFLAMLVALHFTPVTH